MASTAASGARLRFAWIAFAIAMLVQLAVLYAPSTPDGTPQVPGLDKVVHATIFLLPALFGVLAGIRPLRLAVVLVAHAVASELVQHVLLPERSGDAWDAVADVAGVGIGLAVGVVVVRWARSGVRRGRGSVS
ncbi:VanZ family protein [Agrococcus sp. ProA11]|uniref:VanZ family protein n=1 Tax=Agrococcus chionoecetis TaxID=3153752 RepID=UPI0032604C15